MSEVTVKQLADVVGTPVDRLLVQLEEAGLSKTGPDEIVSDDEKIRLLEHLRRSHGKKVSTSSSKVTLKRKSVSELKLGGGATGRTGARSAGSKTVSVEIRKKRTYVKRDAVVDEVQQKRVLEATEAREREALKREAEERRKAEEVSRREAEEEQRKAEEARLKAEEDEKQRLKEEAVQREEAEKQARAQA